MTSDSEYSILVAGYAFHCIECDRTVGKGENYVLKDRWKFCPACGLPERRLRPVVKETVKA